MRYGQIKAVALAAALLAAGSQAQAGTIVAPYFFTWGFGSGSYNIKTLSEAKSKAGIDAVTLAFGVSGGGCTVGGGLETTISNPSFQADIKAYIKSGGRVILSFGGANGTYLESTCSVNDLVAQLRRLIDANGTRSIDWDIEGGQLGDTRLNGVRNAAILQLQSIYPDLTTSFTLPVVPYVNANDTGGLQREAVDLLRGASQSGVKISIVNLMTMDYGSYYSGGKKMGDLAISAATQTVAQLKSLYPAKTDAQLWAMIGITPMIGQNDVASETFTPADAVTVANFAKQKGVGLLSYWAAQRDRVGNGALGEYSRANTRDFEYWQAFAAAKSGTTTPPPAPQPPAPAPRRRPRRRRARAPHPAPRRLRRRTPAPAWPGPKARPSPPARSSATRARPTRRW
ncbi:chitinase [Roseateles chitinivorans]|uniref:chitinase n=1 Tax=Roseateles chitinivorans TaxID=2917965 RepID=UPI003D666FB9